MGKTKIKKVDHITAPMAIRDRETFRNSSGNLSGRWHEPGNDPGGGMLNFSNRALLYAQTRGVSAFVVYSFATPIAWWTEAHGWHRVNQRFSVITSTKHQSRLYLILHG